MSAQEPLMCQLVELLGISETTGLPPSNGPRGAGETVEGVSAGKIGSEIHPQFYAPRLAASTE